MTVLTRFGRLLRADLHALLDRMEAPDVLLQQSLREMQGDLDQRTHQQKARQQEKFQLTQRIAQLDTQRTQYAAEMDLCFQANNDGLIRTLVRRQLESEQLHQTLSAQLAELQQCIDAEDASILEQGRQLQALQQQASVYLRESTPHSPPRSPLDASPITDADVELALLKEMHKRKPS